MVWDRVAFLNNVNHMNRKIVENQQWLLTEKIWDAQSAGMDTEKGEK
jgi:hypothetical protein